MENKCFGETFENKSMCSGNMDKFIYDAVAKNLERRSSGVTVYKYCPEISTPGVLIS